MALTDKDNPAGKHDQVLKLHKAKQNENNVFSYHFNLVRNFTVMPKLKTNTDHMSVLSRSHPDPLKAGTYNQKQVTEFVRKQKHDLEAHVTNSLVGFSKNLGMISKY